MVSRRARAPAGALGARSIGRVEQTRAGCRAGRARRARRRSAAGTRRGSTLQKAPAGLSGAALTRGFGEVYA